MIPDGRFEMQEGMKNKDSGKYGRKCKWALIA